jgi:CTP:phosphocholine cytidylyltransferase-like protein
MEYSFTWKPNNYYVDQKMQKIVAEFNKTNILDSENFLPRNVFHLIPVTYI